MKTGQLITSFLQGKASPTMTSTIFSPYVDHVMEESKTAYLNGLHGATPDTDSPQTKTVGGGVIKGINDLLPYKFRPIKARRRRARARYGWRQELMWMRLTWRTHWKPAVDQAIRQRFKTK